jgi:hypothetical protein
MGLVRVVYASQPFGFDQAMLNGILADARRCNARDGVTGALICRADLYLQWLEGPTAAVEACFARIAADPRHVDVRRLLHGEVEARLFDGWAMRDDPARSWLWDVAAVEGGALERASEADLNAVFARVQTEVD